MEKKFQTHALTLTLIRQCPMANSSKYFDVLQHVQFSNGIKNYFWSYHVHRDTHTDTHTDGHEYSIVAVDKTQL